MAASDTIRPRSGHLSGRVAPPTRVGEAGGSRNLTGAPPPQKRFSLGLHPVSLGMTKEMGWNRSTRQNQPPAKRRVPPNPKPRAALEPRPYRRVVRFRVLICPAVNKRAERRGRRPLQGLKRRCAEAAGGGAARKGGTPGEGSPFNHLLRFVEHKRVPRAAARGQGLRPWTPPAFL